MIFQILFFRCDCEKLQIFVKNLLMILFVFKPSIERTCNSQNVCERSKPIKTFLFLHDQHRRKQPLFHGELTPTLSFCCISCKFLLAFYFIVQVCFASILKLITTSHIIKTDYKLTISRRCLISILVFYLFDII